jgi:RimJ/RimL family protein N-acetyltransferase
MTLQFETARLRLRPFVLADTLLAYPWLTDAEIMRYMPTGQDHTLEQVTARVARYIAHQEQYGYSRWLIYDRATDEPIGDAGLLALPGTNEVELGYRVIKSRWGQGIASEAATGWLDYARQHVGLTELVAFSHPDNGASIRVMEKCGFHFLRLDTVAGMGVKVYLRRLQE